MKSSLYKNKISFLSDVQLGKQAHALLECGQIKHNKMFRAIPPSPPSLLPKDDTAYRSICGARGARARHSAERTHVRLPRRPRHVARRRPGGGAPLAGLPSASVGRRRRLAAQILRVIGSGRRQPGGSRVPGCAQQCARLQRRRLLLFFPSCFFCQCSLSPPSLHSINAPVNYHEEISK